MNAVEGVNGQLCNIFYINKNIPGRYYMTIVLFCADAGVISYHHKLDFFNEWRK